MRITSGMLGPHLHSNPLLEFKPLLLLHFLLILGSTNLHFPPNSLTLVYHPFALSLVTMDPLYNFPPKPVFSDLGSFTNLPKLTSLSPVDICLLVKQREKLH